MLSLDTKFKLKSFKINKLFGRNNVNINFEENIKIFVGENGIGKTTILNVFYYTISNQLYKLRGVEFESIEIEFYPNKTVMLYRDWLFEDNGVDEKAILRAVSPYLGVREYNTFKKLLHHNSREYIIDLVMDMHHVPESIKERLFYGFHKTNSKNSNLELFGNLAEFKEDIKTYLNEEILYFPTYRRIEEDLFKVGANIYEEQLERTEEGEIIKFGMGDVQDVFDKIEDEIKKSSLEGYSRITGEMITHLVHNYKVTSKMKDRIKDTETLNIVLDRAGKNLRDIDKEKIRELIRTNELFNDKEHKYDPLVFFLFNLMDIYEKHRVREDAIKGFRDVCNRYLVNKKVEYDESAVNISIVDKKSNDDIKLKNLSSGEKQIVSLFTRIYLTSNKNFIVLFDEPELSLSIEWQERLLPDIVGSGRCAFLLAVTHSPFVYNNNLEDYAQSMELFVEEVGTNE
ncbi:AAA family ATPase [Bacillus cereus]|uniref:AAA family ATPase n=1 Tax=Bacillus cereus TaxID=1396 RepID=UPI00227D4B65|nr:AAA family ATPase [Bacillus cereus]WAI12300.1 AAA family ATPase [Bacillus cereus]